MGWSKGKEPVAGAKDKEVVQSVQAIKEVSPFQKRLDDRGINMFDWMEGTGKWAGKPKDITEAPGMENYLDLYGNAEAMAQTERFGDPVTAFSGRGTSSSPFLKQVQEQNKMKRYDARASGLNQGLAGLQSDALNGVASSAEADQHRREAYSQGLGQFNNNFYNRPQRQNPWMQGISLALGGLNTAKNLGVPF